MSLFKRIILAFKDKTRICNYNWQVLKLWTKNDLYRKIRKDQKCWFESRTVNLGLIAENRLSVPMSMDGRYIWASIIRTENLGNYLIEYCLKRVLQLPEPYLTIDVLRTEFPKRLDGYQFIVNPGTTTLYQSPRLDTAFEKLMPGKIPIICFGASIWYRWYSDRQNELLDEEKLTQIARKMRYPIGCRDLFTYELLHRNGVKAEFIGCPTLFCQGHTTANGYIAFSFGRDNLPEQIKLLRHLTKKQSIKVLIHRSGEEEYCRGLRVEIIKDLSQFLSVYYGAKYVISGRLHGALPGISAHKPVFYFQGIPHFDSRLTLLSYLGLPIQTIDRMYDIDPSIIQYDFNRVTHLKEAFCSYARRFKEHFAL